MWGNIYEDRGSVLNVVGAGLIAGSFAVGYGGYYLFVTESPLAGLAALLSIPVGFLLLPTSLALSQRISIARKIAIGLFGLLSAFSTVMLAAHWSTAGVFNSGPVHIAYLSPVANGLTIPIFSLYALVVLVVASEKFQSDDEKREQMVEFKQRQRELE